MDLPVAQSIADASPAAADSGEMTSAASGSVMVTGVGGLMDLRFMVVGLDVGGTVASLSGAQDYTGFLWKCFLFEIWRRRFERGFQEIESALEASPAAGRDPATARRPKKLYLNPREPLRSGVSPKPR